MPTSFAHGTGTSKRIPGATLAARRETPTDVELATLTTAAKIERLLVPQQAALRATVLALRSAASLLAREGAAGAQVLGRIVGVTDDLTRSMGAHFDHAERVLFPSVIEGRASAQVAGTIHDYHESVATRLRWLRLLAAELRAAAGITYDTMVVFAAIATLARLFHRHRDLELWLALTGPESRAAASSPSPRPARAARP